MKKETAPKNSKDFASAALLKENNELISANMLRIIAKLGLIKSVDAVSIEHDAAKVKELSHNEALRQLKDVNGDFLMDLEQIHHISEQPNLVFKKEEPPVKPTPPVEQPVKKDEIDLFVEKLNGIMKSSKHFPHSLRELAKLIKQHLVKKGDQLAAGTTQAKELIMKNDADENKLVENVLRRMNDKGMFTRKMKTGESKEHAKDHVKLKF